jgi:CheY-like chemotaxis protein
VLVVEDNIDGREMLRLMLQLWGYQVTVASDGIQGVQKALSEAPDFALVDIGLPQLDGYEVARRLRATFGPRIFLAAMTGYGLPQDAHRALESGFDIHLVKPIDPDLLQKLLAGSRPTAEATSCGAPPTD